MPPEGVTEAIPSHTPLQEISVISTVIEIGEGYEMETLSIVIQPFESVTVSV